MFEIKQNGSILTDSLDAAIALSRQIATGCPTPSASASPVSAPVHRLPRQQATLPEAHGGGNGSSEPATDRRKPGRPKAGAPRTTGTASRQTSIAPDPAGFLAAIKPNARDVMLALANGPVDIDELVTAAKLKSVKNLPPIVIHVRSMAVQYGLEPLAVLTLEKKSIGGKMRTVYTLSDEIASVLRGGQVANEQPANGELVTA